MLALPPGSARGPEKRYPRIGVTGGAMKPLSIAVAILATTALMLGGCKHRKEEPVPGPKAAHPAAEIISAPAGIVTRGRPLNVSSRSVAGLIAPAPADIAT